MKNNIELDKGYIKKSDIMEFITNGLNSSRFGNDAVQILTEIHFTPNADVQEVVRCKDCKHCLKDLTWREAHLCMRSSLTISVKLDDYCSYGAKMDGGKK